jgi:adenylosuccinate lyase
VALENVPLEHERDLTNSSAERAIIGESFILTDEILKSTESILKNLVFHPENIEKNLNTTRGLNMAEAVMIKFVEKGMGRQDAHELLRQLSVTAVSEDSSFEAVLLEDDRVTRLLSKGEIRDAVDPRNYIGTAVRQVQDVLRESSNERKDSKV